MIHFILGFIIGGLVTLGITGFIIYKMFLKDFRIWK